MLQKLPHQSNALPQGPASQSAPVRRLAATDAASITLSFESVLAQVGARRHGALRADQAQPLRSPPATQSEPPTPDRDAAAGTEGAEAAQTQLTKVEEDGAQAAPTPVSIPDPARGADDPVDHGPEVSVAAGASDMRLLQQMRAAPGSPAEPDGARANVGVTPKFPAQIKAISHPLDARVNAAAVPPPGDRTIAETPAGRPVPLGNARSPETSGTPAIRTAPANRDGSDGVREIEHPPKPPQLAANRSYGPGAGGSAPDSRHDPADRFSRASVPGMMPARSTAPEAERFSLADSRAPRAAPPVRSDANQASEALVRKQAGQRELAAGTQHVFSADATGSKVSHGMARSVPPPPDPARGAVSPSPNPRAPGEATKTSEGAATQTSKGAAVSLPGRARGNNFSVFAAPGPIGATLTPDYLQPDMPVVPNTRSATVPDARGGQQPGFASFTGVGGVSAVTHGDGRARAVATGQALSSVHGVMTPGEASLGPPAEVKERAGFAQGPANSSTGSDQVMQTAAAAQPVLTVGDGVMQPGGAAEPRDARLEATDLRTNADLQLQQRALNDLSLPRAELPRHISQQMAEALQQRGAAQQIELQLNPRELGRVSMHLQTIDNSAVIHIVADRPETLDLMRRHIEMLAQDFRSIGYGEARFSFSAFGDEPRKDKAMARDVPTAEPQADPAVDTAASVDRSPPVATDRLDIRV